MSRDRFRIILGKCKGGSREPVAASFAELFGVHESLARQIAQAAPIVILADLQRDQAMEIVQALGPLRASGADLRIEISDDRSISQVAWPNPPTVAGKEIAAYEPLTPRAGELVFACPECGCRLRLEVARAEESAAKAKDQPVSPKPEEKAAAKEPDEDEAPPDLALELDGDPLSTGLTPPPSPGIDKLQESGRDDLLFDNVMPLAETGGSSAVVGSLRDFETSLKRAVSDVAQEVENAGDMPTGAEESVPPKRPARPDSGRLPGARGSGGRFNVVIPRTGNPQVIPLLMEDLRVSEDEARGEMKKPLIAVGRGLSREEAIKIAARYKRIGLNPRIGRKR